MSKDDDAPPTGLDPSRSRGRWRRAAYPRAVALAARTAALSDARRPGRLATSDPHLTYGVPSEYALQLALPILL